MTAFTPASEIMKRADHLLQIAKKKQQCISGAFPAMNLPIYPHYKARQQDPIYIVPFPHSSAYLTC